MQAAVDLYKTGQQLEDGHLLEEYGVEKHPSILLVKKLNGKQRCGLITVADK